MLILGIETSCDETAAAVVKDGKRILSSVVGTQFEKHRPYSGVVPELASRAHVELINTVIERALEKSNVKPSKLDAIAVTVGPGLAGALLVGKMSAEALGWVHNIPVYGTNHIEGHLLSPLLTEENLKPPFLGLVVSGGHTELIAVKRWGVYEMLGRTRDDAAGEAFDKVARMLGLGYPGGPLIDRMAIKGTAHRSPFPRAWLPGTWDFSFSGLKTAVLYKLRMRSKWARRDKADICAGFQESVVDVLIKKTLGAAQVFGLKTIIVGGGVAANTLLRREFKKICHENKIQLLMAPLSLCTDNAAMVAASLYVRMKKGTGAPSLDLTILPQLHLPYLKNLRGGFDLNRLS